jgi:hypothetical protein
MACGRERSTGQGRIVVARKRTAATPRGEPRTPDPSPSTTPQQDEATDAVPATRPPQTPYKDMKLPHERDESAVGEASEGRDPARTRRPIRQAQEDVASGKQNTDCYDAVAPRYQAKEGGTAPDARERAASKHRTGSKEPTGRRR